MSSEDLSLYLFMEKILGETHSSSAKVMSVKSLDWWTTFGGKSGHFQNIL